MITPLCQIVSPTSCSRIRFALLALLTVLAVCVSPATGTAQATAPPLFVWSFEYLTSTDATATASAAGDVNGDGKLDLVVADDDSSIAVLLGNGDGTFQQPADVSFGFEVTSIVIADVNGDRKPDLIVAASFESAFQPLEVLLGNGNGTFQPAVVYPSGGTNPIPPTSENGLTGQVYVADVNGDGKPDLLAVNEQGGPNGSGSIGVLLGNGDGTFHPVVSYGSGGSFATSLVVADINGDGKLDLVVGNCGMVSAGCGSNLDGAIGVLMGNGDGTFQTAKSYSSGGVEGLYAAVAVTVADLNGDGKPDLIVPNEEYESGSVGVLINKGDGTFRRAVDYASGGGGPNLAFVADVNGDGKLDLVVNNVGPFFGSIGVLLGNGDGTFKTAKSYSTGVSQTSFAAIADVNGDGIPDVTVTDAASAAVLLGNSDGSFQASQIVYAGGYVPVNLTVADVNGDARPDLLITSSCVVYDACYYYDLAPTGLFDVLLNNTGAPNLNALTFSPPSGVYLGAQTVTVSDEVAGAKIYYTTDGSTPTASSTPYAGPISVSSTERVTAVAAAGGATSAIATSAYTIATKTPASAIDFAVGFAGAQGQVQLNGGAELDKARLQLTAGHVGELPGSAFYATPVNVRAFTTYFSFQLTDANGDADGITFAIQNAGPTALGTAGEGLGYEGIGNSAAVKFDMHNNDGEGPDSTGLFVDGAPPTVPAIDLSDTGIDLHSGDVFLAQAAYNGASLALTLTDTATLATWSRSFAIDIPAAVGGETAYVGFTGATGDGTAKQEVLSWTYVSGTPGAAVPPLAAQPAPNYTAGFTATSLALNGSTSLAGPILQLTDGGVGEAGSAFYSVPVNIQAFASEFTFLLYGGFPPADLADGITFTIQNVSDHALGGGGEELGYAPIAKSVAIKFDTHNDAGEGPDSTGLYVDGALPTVPALDLDSIDLHSGDVFSAQITYNGTRLNLLLTDTFTQKTWSRSFPIDIPKTVGGNTAFVGFTGGSGSEVASQQILAWTFTNP